MGIVLWMAQGVSAALRHAADMFESRRRRMHVVGGQLKMFKKVGLPEAMRPYQALCRGPSRLGQGVVRARTMHLALSA